MRPLHFVIAALAIAAIGAAAILVGDPSQASATLYVLLLMTLGVTGLILAFRDAHNALDVDSEMPDEQGGGELRSYYLGEVVKKHPQHILAMEQEFFDFAVHFTRDLNVLAAESFLNWPQTASALTIREREALEPDEGYRQVLPYVVVRQIGRDGVLRYLAYRRTKRVGEQRLAGKVSIGFGGHIDAADVVVRGDSTIDLRATILDCAERELREELGVMQAGRIEPLAAWVSAIAPAFAHLFITHNEGVQRVHLGVVLYFDVPSDVTLCCAEEELETMGMYTAEELAVWMTAASAPELEVWSQLLVEHYLGAPGHQPV